MFLAAGWLREDAKPTSLAQWVSLCRNYNIQGFCLSVLELKGSCWVAAEGKCYRVWWRKPELQKELGSRNTDANLLQERLWSLHKHPLIRIKLGWESLSDRTGQHSLFLLTPLLSDFFFSFFVPCCVTVPLLIKSGAGAELQGSLYYSSRLVLLASCTDCLGNTFLPFRLTQKKSGRTQEARKRTVIWVTLCFWDVIALSSPQAHRLWLAKRVVRVTWLHVFVQKTALSTYTVRAVRCGGWGPTAPPRGWKNQHIAFPTETWWAACNQYCCLIKAVKCVLHGFLLSLCRKKLLLHSQAGMCSCSQPQRFRHAICTLSILFLSYQKQEWRGMHRLSHTHTEVSVADTTKRKERGEGSKLWKGITILFGTVLLNTYSCLFTCQTPMKDRDCQVTKQTNTFSDTCCNCVCAQEQLSDGGKNGCTWKVKGSFNHPGNFIRELVRAWADAACAHPWDQEQLERSPSASISQLHSPPFQPFTGAACSHTQQRADRSTAPASACTVAAGALRAAWECRMLRERTRVDRLVRIWCEKEPFSLSQGKENDNINDG